MARLSIKGKLQKARTKGKAVSILTEWSKSYKGQILYVINAMDKAKARGDLRTIGFLIGELTAIQDKLFTGLNSITQHNSSSRTCPPWIRTTQRRCGPRKKSDSSFPRLGSPSRGFFAWKIKKDTMGLFSLAEKYPMC